jgi:hypothetical protein
MTVNAIERENIRLATDNRRLRLENAQLTLALEEIQQETSTGTMWNVHSIIVKTWKKLPNCVPGASE